MRILYLSRLTSCTEVAGYIEDFSAISGKGILFKLSAEEVIFENVDFVEYIVNCFVLPIWEQLLYFR